MIKNRHYRRENKFKKALQLGAEGSVEECYRWINQEIGTYE